MQTVFYLLCWFLFCDGLNWTLAVHWLINSNNDKNNATCCMLQYAEDIVLIICFLIFQSLILSTAVPTIIGFSLWREVWFLLFRNLWVKCLDAYKKPVFLQYCPRVLAELSDLHDFYDSDMVELISWIRWIIVSVIVIDEVGVVI